MPRSKDKGRAGVPPSPSFDAYFFVTRADVNPDLARWENEGGACLPGRSWHALLDARMAFNSGQAPRNALMGMAKPNDRAEPVQ